MATNKWGLGVSLHPPTLLHANVRRRPYPLKDAGRDLDVRLHRATPAQLSLPGTKGTAEQANRLPDYLWDQYSPNPLCIIFPMGPN